MALALSIGGATQRWSERQRCAIKERDVENWGQGPWFELDRDDDTGSVDSASGADVAARETASRPLAAPPGAPPDAMEPRGGDIADGLGGVDSAPANIFDLGADVAFPDAHPSGRPAPRVTRPPRPSAPYYPSTAPSRAAPPST